jgi:DNA methylase
MLGAQRTLFEHEPILSAKATTTFAENLSIPVHRWFRYSAGFSAEWVEALIRDELRAGKEARVLDPFVGSGTTLIAAEHMSVSSCGIEAHPFVFRIAEAKLAWRSDPEAYRTAVRHWIAKASGLNSDLTRYPPLVKKCFSQECLGELDKLRRAYELLRSDAEDWKLVWLTLICILRPVSHVGTAQWQYILPKKRKRAPLDVHSALARWSDMIYADLKVAAEARGPRAQILNTDARTCEGIQDGWATLIITSPPYPNNYDYADATRLEMTFMGEIRQWRDLQNYVRKHLVRSCSQHVPESAVDLKGVLSVPELDPIRSELSEVCSQLEGVRESHGGRKTYHLMVACYFRDLAQVWRALRRAASKGARACFVIGDSAPYGVYVPVIPWLGKLALSAGFRSFDFEKTRDRNVKWKNRKHRVPLQEGRLWVWG